MFRVGTVGIPLPGTTIRIASDGEILVKGIGVFKGYHNNPAATEAAFVDGFFRTGDLGELDQDGFSPSPAARRTCWSLPVARTSPRHRWRRSSVNTNWWARQWSSAMESRSLPH